MAKILIVEDHPVNMRLFVTYIKAMGHEVVCTVDVPEALECIKEHTFDLIVTDIALPGMSGLDLATYIKTTPELMHIPILCITAFYGMHNEAASKKAGCTEYLGKPMTNIQLRQKINSLLNIAA